MVDEPAQGSAPSTAVKDEVLKAIANELRLKILVVLGDNSSDGYYETLRFSTLMDNTEIDDSGKLNYHLSKLRENGYIVEIDDGYKLTLRGLKAYQAVKSGFYLDNFDTEFFAIDKSHPECGEKLYARYQDQRVSIICRNCDIVFHKYPIPPGPFNTDSTSKIVEALEVRFAIDVCSMTRGFCPYCSGPVYKDIGHEHMDRMDVDDWEAPGVLFVCSNCHWFFYCTLDRPTRYHPRVMSFFYERDINIWKTPAWDPRTKAEDTVISENPWKIALKYSCDGDSLEVIIDDDLEIIRSNLERTP